MSYSIYDFVRCPESDCSDGKVGIDYYNDGKRIFLSFSCLSCESGSLEDDIRWYVKCPNCLDNPTSGVDRIESDINENGVVSFRCRNCGCSAKSHVRTRWDDEDSNVRFEPHPY